MSDRVNWCRGRNAAALFAAFAALASTVPARAQVPPPPIPESQAPLVNTLKQAYAAKDLKLYESLLAEEVTVTLDGRTVARGKKEWIKSFGPKLTTPGVFFTVNASYESSGNILNIEYFNSAESFAINNRDCCWSYDAVQYSISDAKISSIRILSGGDPAPK